MRRTANVCFSVFWYLEVARKFANVLARSVPQITVTAVQSVTSIILDCSAVAKISVMQKLSEAPNFRFGHTNLSAPQ
jgi:hypothetical protein